jgi:uncharacterized protein (TIGR03067 family)
LTGDVAAGYTPNTISKEAAMSRTVLLLLAAVSLGFAPAPFLPRKLTPVEAELKALQGAWVETSRFLNGTDEVRSGGYEVSFEGNLERTKSDQVKIVLDATKSPCRMVETDEVTEYHLLRIYRLKGDTLTLCHYLDARSECAYPPDFTPRAGVLVQVLKRKRR